MTKTGSGMCFSPFGLGWVRAGVRGPSGALGNGGLERKQLADTEYPVSDQNNLEKRTAGMII